MIKISMTASPEEMERFIKILKKNKGLSIIRTTPALEQHGSALYKRWYMDVRLRKDEKDER